MTTATTSFKRQRLIAVLVGASIGLSATGCASRPMSLSSMNPFKSKDSLAETSAAPKTNSPNAIASAATGVGNATKKAFTSTTSTVGGWFGRDGKQPTADPSDPLTLQAKTEPVGADVFVANGQLWESTGNLTKAMESYSKALETEPNHSAALTSIARLHFREGNHPQAAQFFQKAIAQSPNDAALYNDLGLTLSKLGQHDMAGQTIARALQLAPGTSRYANNLASVQFDAGKSSEAFQTLSHNNKPAVANFNMAYLYYKKGQTAQAQTHLQQAIAFDGESAADPATKRAVERSREMLAQMAPGGKLPAQNIAAAPNVTPGATLGAAAGPVAVVAANPANKATLPGFGVTNSPTSGNVLSVQSPAAGPFVFGGGPSVPPTQPPTAPVGYQDPRSFMLPSVPTGAPTTTQTPTTNSTIPPTWKPTAPPTTPPSATPAPGGTFQLPPGFGT